MPGIKIKRRKHSDLISVKDQKIIWNGCSKTFPVTKCLNLHFTKILNARLCNSIAIQVANILGTMSGH